MRIVLAALPSADRRSRNELISAWSAPASSCLGCRLTRLFGRRSYSAHLSLLIQCVSPAARGGCASPVLDEGSGNLRSKTSDSAPQGAPGADYSSPRSTGDVRCATHVNSSSAGRPGWGLPAAVPPTARARWSVRSAAGRRRRPRIGLERDLVAPTEQTMNRRTGPRHHAQARVFGAVGPGNSKIAVVCLIRDLIAAGDGCYCRAGARGDRGPRSWVSAVPMSTSRWLPRQKRRPRIPRAGTGSACSQSSDSS